MFSEFLVNWVKHPGPGVGGNWSPPHELRGLGELFFPMFLMIFFSCVLNDWIFTNWGYEDPLPPSPLWSGHFYFTSYGRLYLKFTRTHLDFQVCSRPKKKSFKTDQIYRKDEQWAEANEKSILQFLRFSVLEIWLILYWT